VIDNTQLFFERWRANSKETSRDIGELVMLLQKFNQQLDLAREALALTTEHLDFIDLRLVLNLLAGSQGEIGITVSDILAQAPLSLWAALPKDLSFGFESPVPFLTTVRPQNDGGINIEVLLLPPSPPSHPLSSSHPVPQILHCGSKDIQQRATFYEWESGVGRQQSEGTNPKSSKATPPQTSPQQQQQSSLGFQKADPSSIGMPSVSRERSYESADSDPSLKREGEDLFETASTCSSDSLPSKSRIHLPSPPLPASLIISRHDSRYSTKARPFSFTISFSSSHHREGHR
jgi:hypothetical protein